MALEKVMKFEALASGTELLTPTGVGKFKTYKKGNFKKQNVLVEHEHGKLKWYTEDVLKLAVATSRMAISHVQAGHVTANMGDMHYYAI
ncbi:hypothetical protein FVR03_08300 [Pontibacter qinzhouensis]|uniref:Uncharacterized protein n=1 Tax=Pontibacter qinzhouensis TaxID=2603253 RepID=A0A5C8K9M5_9BACT|nr:hypothetical protein [Pontibacter qinzhouensis]TXK48159.1 hypothetical protein FVR03_08300 [Pontibacter qinzhouensis]